MQPWVSVFSSLLQGCAANAHTNLAKEFCCSKVKRCVHACRNPTVYRLVTRHAWISSSLMQMKDVSLLICLHAPSILPFNWISSGSCACNLTTMASVGKTELEELEYYADTTPLFLSDIYQGNKKPGIRVDLESEPRQGLPLKVTLLKLYCDVRQCGKHKNSSAIDVWNLVVMDATQAIFKVVLNSGMQDIPHEELHPGSTIIIQEQDYKVILKQKDETVRRGIVFVDNFDWGPAPKHTPTDDDSSAVTPDFCTIYVDTKLIECVAKECRMIFTRALTHKEGFGYLMEMRELDVRQGEFIPDPSVRSAYLRSFRIGGKRLASVLNEPCQCIQDPFHFEECIAYVHPVTGVDVDELFYEVKEKLKGRVTAENFGQLTHSHKRWCLHWHYAINFLHFGGGEAQQLPSCLVAEIRRMYPDDVYTGFKTIAERQASLDI